MRKAEYKVVSVEEEKSIIHHEETFENGELVLGAWDEEIVKEIPVMGIVYTDITKEEAMTLPIVDEWDDFTDMSYAEIVEYLIRKRYSLSEELSILRQRDTKADEFNEYNSYADECKTRAKEISNA